MCNGEELQNNRMLFYYNINKLSTLTITEKFKIFVELATTKKSKIVTLQVNGSDTIEDVKTVIAEEQQQVILSDHDELQLYFCGKKLADELSLDDHDIPM